MNLWNRDLQCCVATAVFNFEERKAVLVLPENNCTDMEGAIRWASRVMPSVAAIVVWEGPALAEGVCYRKGDGEWRADEFRSVPVAAH